MIIIFLIFIIIHRIGADTWADPLSVLSKSQKLVFYVCDTFVIGELIFNGKILSDPK